VVPVKAFHRKFVAIWDFDLNTHLKNLNKYNSTMVTTKEQINILA
jgi:hypothetical protein